MQRLFSGNGHFVYLRTFIMLVLILSGFAGSAIGQRRDQSRRNRQQQPPPTDCTWRTYFVEARGGRADRGSWTGRGSRGRGGDGSAERPFASLAAALAAASDESVCGQTIILAPGRYALGRWIVNKPTILQGGWRAGRQQGHAETTIVGSIINASGWAVRLAELTIADAPFPGAIFSAHPQAQIVIVDTTITRSNGAGVTLHGGRLEIIDSRIEFSRLRNRRSLGRELRRLVSMLPRVGRNVPSHLDRMQEALDALPDGVITPQFPIDLEIAGRARSVDD